MPFCCACHARWDISPIQAAQRPGCCGSQFQRNTLSSAQTHREQSVIYHMARSLFGGHAPGNTPRGTLSAGSRAQPRYIHGVEGRHSVGRHRRTSGACIVDGCQPPCVCGRGGCRAAWPCVGACHAAPAAAAGASVLNATPCLPPVVALTCLDPSAWHIHAYVSVKSHPALGQVGAQHLFLPAVLIARCPGSHVQPLLAPLPALAMQEGAEFESNFMEPVKALEGANGSQPRHGSRA